MIRDALSFTLGAAALAALRVSVALPAHCRTRGESIAEVVLGLSILVSRGEPT